MFKFLINIKEIIIALLLAFGAIFGIYNAGRNSKKNEISKQTLSNVRKAKGIDEDINNLSHDELVSRLRRFKRK